MWLRWVCINIFKLWLKTTLRELSWKIYSNSSGFSEISLHIRTIFYNLPMAILIWSYHFLLARFTAIVFAFQLYDFFFTSCKSLNFHECSLLYISSWTHLHSTFFFFWMVTHLHYWQEAIETLGFSLGEEDLEIPAFQVGLNML